MSELRYDPLFRTWVLISDKRAKRPIDIRNVEEERCVFCPGNEDQTLPEILRFPPGGTRWQVRVVPNKFSALAIEIEQKRTDIGGVFLKENGVGAHEVIIDHPYEDHRHTAELSRQEMFLVLYTIKSRMDDLVRDKRFKYPVLFKNFGSKAGASQRHPHWQLIVLPFTPRLVQDILDTCRDYFDEKKCCFICQMIAFELSVKERVVMENEAYAVFSYYASSFPYELIIFPKDHEYRFEWTGEENLNLLAATFLETLRKLRKATDDEHFNIMLYTSPWFENEVCSRNDVTIEHGFHWHFRIRPRSINLAGFEFGSGFIINPKRPEEAARILREVEAYVEN